MEKAMMISPQKLFPTESLSSIQNEKLQLYLNEYRNGKSMEKPLVFMFDNEYYILRGHHLVLAAIMAGVTEISVRIVNNKEYPFWNEDQNIIDTLNGIGMSTLYDFETIGGFAYKTYPDYYKR